MPAVIDELDDGVDDEPTSLQKARSVACLVTGGAATAAALALGWQNVTNLISGGIVPAAGPGAIALGLFGVVFTSFCAIGQALTPLYLDLTREPQLPSPTPRGNRPPASTAGEVASPVVINASVRGGPACLTLYSNGPRAGFC